MNDLGSLSGCMLENDAEARNRARRLRQKALVVSIAIEATLIAAMLLWPLITPGVLTGRFNVTPAPPYHGGGATEGHPLSTWLTAANTQHRPRLCLMCEAAIPVHAHAMSDSTRNAEQDAPDVGYGPADGNVGNGPVIPGGANSGIPIENKSPQSPSQPAPLHMSEGVMEAQLIQKVQPLYPAVAREMRLAGTVRVRAVIGTDGTVHQVEVLSGSQLLAQSAIAAVRQWRYRPTQLNGQPVEVETFVTVNFVLDQP
jgi:protein TonB